MTKKIKTIKSSNEKEFDKLVNIHLEQGWELVDGGYSVLENIFHSQVIVFETNKFNHIEYYENEMIKELGNFKDGNRTGEWIYYEENGQIQSKGNYKYYDDIQIESKWIHKDEENWFVFEESKYRHGKWTYYRNGKIEKEENYKYGNLIGKNISYYDNGEIEKEENYKYGKKKRSTKILL